MRGGRHAKIQIKASCRPSTASACRSGCGGTPPRAKQCTKFPGSPQFGCENIKFIRKRNMWKSFFISTLLAVTAQSTHAVFKCGNTYSQTPCASDAIKLGIDSTPNSTSSLAPNTSPEQVEKNIKLCERALREVPSWKDRDSLKISPIKRLPKTMVVQIKSQKREAILYVSSINGKNSYGAYQGEKFAACYFDLKDEKLLDYLIGS